MKLGGVSSTTLLRCPRCERGVSIPPGEILLVLAQRTGKVCHMVKDPNTGVVSSRG